MFVLSEDGTATQGWVSPFCFQASPSLSDWARGSLFSNYTLYFNFLVTPEPLALCDREFWVIANLQQHTLNIYNTCTFIFRNIYIYIYIYAIRSRTVQRVKVGKRRSSLNLIHSHKYACKPIKLTIWLRITKIRHQTN